jgi:hypothetical protein
MKRTGRINSVLKKNLCGVALPWEKVKEDLCECPHYQSRHHEGTGRCLGKIGQSDNACLCQKFRQRK